jgi:hypothetical protein
MIASGFSSQFRLDFEGHSTAMAAKIGAEMTEKLPREPA